MATELIQIRDRIATILFHSRTRKTVIWLVTLIAGYGILLGLVAPPLLRGRIANALSTKLHREVSIQQLKLNPYKLTVAVRGFLMKERQSQSPALSFDELFVDLDIRSLLRIAPVIEELRLAKPYLNLVRNDNGKYNFQDLIDEFTSGPSGPTPRFALNNIQINDGKIDFDDRPEQTEHSITGLKIGVPFISSLPAHIDIKVKPEFSAVVNGSPFHFAGVTTTPFKDTLASTLAIDIDKLEIAKYLGYSPVTLNFKVPSGQLHGKITLNFTTSRERATVLQLTGSLGVTELEMQQTNGAPLLKLPRVEVLIDSIRLFANRTSLKSVKAQGLELYVDRSRDGKLSLANLVETQSSPVAAEPKPEAKPFHFSIDDIAVDSATVHIDDGEPQRPYKTRLDNFKVQVTGLTNEPEKKANVEISFETADKEKFSHTGTFQMTPLLAEGKLDVNALRVGPLRPYYENALAAEIKDGLLDLSTEYTFAKKAEQSAIKLTGLKANLRSFRLDLDGQPEPLWRVGTLAIKDGSVDVAKKTIVIGALAAKDGNGYIQRHADGVNMARIAKAQAPAPPTAQPAKTDESPWRVDVNQIAFDRFRVSVDDQNQATPVKLSLADVTIRYGNFSTAKNQRSEVKISTRVNDKGLLKLDGTLTIDPVNGKLTVEAQDLDILPFQPFFGDQVNFLVTEGRLGTKGELSIDAGGNGPVQVTYQGGAQVANFGTVEKDSRQDLLKWKSLALDALKFASEPFQLRIGALTLSDFYSRLILDANGKLNLQKLTAGSEEQPGEPRAAPAKATEKLAPAPAAEAVPARAVQIGKIKLQNGNINFSDFFIKPNYSAHLTGVEGTISELKPEIPGNLDLHAKLDNAAPVVIKGKINPLSKELFLDLVADAKEIELNPMTPYSVKYVGYGIEKGKLSFNVEYKLDNRKLTAENKIILNQLTFGDKVESPDATALPVRLAVALLKDRNGVIDIDLPISGSLDDPQFSIGGIVLRLVFGIISKAVTAPFSLLAAAFGGGSDSPSGDELSYIEFASGRAAISEAGQAKIATLAKALYNRPALNLELIGRVDPASDLEGLKRVAIERKVKAQKLKDLVRRGGVAKSLDEVQVDPKEYPQYLKAAYGEENFSKPRNVIGLAQDLPVPDMEKLMLQHAKAGDDELRQLAQARAQAVRDALLGAGQIDAERLSIATGKPLTSDEAAKLKGKLNRVEFTMK